MTNNRWDGTLNGVQFRLRRGGEAYTRFFSRQTVEEQFILPTGGRTSRDDRRKFYQTSWADGGTWFRPLMTEAFQATYEYARGMDTLRIPGALVPYNKVNTYTEATRGVRDKSPIIAAPPHTGGGASTIYGISTTNDGTDYFLRFWNNTTNAWANAAGTVGSDPDKYGLIYNPPNGYFYAWDDTKISYTDGTISTGDDAITVTSSFGSAIVPGLLGSPYFFDGDVLYEVGLTSLTTVTDDGLGRTIALASTGTKYTAKHFRHCVSTSEGIYYMKNVWSGGLPSCWVFRVERDAAGNIISVPFATLPTGVLGLCLGFALGNPVILGTFEWAKALENSNHFKTELWSAFGGTIGLLGTFNTLDPQNHDASAPFDTVSQIIGHHEGRLILGSVFGVWAYDPIRGGIHYMYDTGCDVQEYVFVPQPDQNRYLHQNDYIADPTVQTDLQGVASIGDDTYTNQLFSNWFDFDLPGEEKTITQIQTQIADFDQFSATAYQVSIYDDDGTEYTSPGHQHGCSTTFHTSTGWSVKSERFRYRLNSNTLNAGVNSGVSPLINIIITAETGEMVQGWQLTIDGTEFRNVEGVQQNPQDVYDNWVNLGLNKSVITFVDAFEGYDRDGSTSHSVRIQSVQISKTEPGEAQVKVVLIDAS